MREEAELDGMNSRSQASREESELDRLRDEAIVICLTLPSDDGQLDAFVHRLRDDTNVTWLADAPADSQLAAFLSHLDPHQRSEVEHGVIEAVNALKDILSRPSFFTQDAAINTTIAKTHLTEAFPWLSEKAFQSLWSCSAWLPRGSCPPNSFSSS